MLADFLTKTKICVEKIKFIFFFLSPKFRLLYYTILSSPLSRILSLTPLTLST